MTNKMSAIIRNCRFWSIGSLQGGLTDIFKTNQHSFKKKRFLLFWSVLCFGLCLLLFGQRIAAQTDFAPGDIMFTGYKSDDANAFSFVLLADVVSGTVIYITDRGWSNSLGYRNDTNGEGTISFTFTSDYSCGSEFFLMMWVVPMIGLRQTVAVFL